jgi:hypothetical protein
VLHDSAVQKHRRCTTEVTIRRVRVTIDAVEKQLVLSITNGYLYSCFVIPQANRIFRSQYYIVIMTRLAAYTIFCHIISLMARFSEKAIENKTCVWMYSTTSV